VRCHIGDFIQLLAMHQHAKRGSAVGDNPKNADIEAGSVLGVTPVISARHLDGKSGSRGRTGSTGGDGTRGVGEAVNAVYKTLVQLGRDPHPDVADAATAVRQYIRGKRHLSSQLQHMIPGVASSGAIDENAPAPDPAVHTSPEAKASASRASANDNGSRRRSVGGATGPGAMRHFDRHKMAHLQRAHATLAREPSKPPLSAKDKNSPSTDTKAEKPRSTKKEPRGDADRPSTTGGILGMMGESARQSHPATKGLSSRASSTVNAAQSPTAQTAPPSSAPRGKPVPAELKQLESHQAKDARARASDKLWQVPASVIFKLASHFFTRQLLGPAPGQAGEKETMALLLDAGVGEELRASESSEEVEDSRWRRRRNRQVLKDADTLYATADERKVPTGSSGRSRSNSSISSSSSRVDNVSSQQRRGSSAARELLENRHLNRWQQFGLIHTGWEETTCVLLHPYEPLLVASGDCGRVGVYNYDVEHHAEKETLNQFHNAANSTSKRRGDAVRSMHFLNPDHESLLMCTSDNGNVKVWKGVHVPDEQSLCTAFNCTDGLLAHGTNKRYPKVVTDWSQANGLLACSGHGIPTVTLWDVNYERAALTFEVTTSHAGVESGGSLLYGSVTQDSSVPASSSLAGAGSSSGNNRSGSKRTYVTSLMWHPDAATRQLFVGTRDGFVMGYDFRMSSRSGSASHIKVLEHFTNPAGDLSAPSRVVTVGMQRNDPNRLSCVLQNGVVHTVDLRMMTATASVCATRGGDNKSTDIDAVCMHQMAPVLAAGSLKRAAVDVYDFNVQKNLQTIRYHIGFLGQRIGPISSLHFHPHRFLLATGSIDPYLSIFVSKGNS
jgi:WD40 repeat protein